MDGASERDVGVRGSFRRTSMGEMPHREGPSQDGAARLRFAGRCSSEPKLLACVHTQDPRSSGQTGAARESMGPGAIVS